MYIELIISNEINVGEDDCNCDVKRTEMTSDKRQFDSMKQ